jgi:hypothetical protein
MGRTSRSKVTGTSPVEAAKRGNRREWKMAK